MSAISFLSAALGGFLLMTVIGIQVLIALFSSIPLANRRSRKCPEFNLKKAHRRIVSIMVLGSIFMTVVTILMVVFAPGISSSGYLFGLIAALVRSIRRMSPTDRRNQQSFERMFADCYPDAEEVEESPDATRQLFPSNRRNHD